MEDQQIVNCLVTPLEEPGGDVLSGAAKAFLAAAALTCVGAPPKPGLEMILADLSNGSYISPGDSQFWQSPPGVDRLCEPCIVVSGASPVSDHLQGLMANLEMPKTWRDEGIEAPSLDCRQFSLQVFRRLFDNYGIIPYKITLSKDGGIFAAYKSPRSKNILRVEIDNDLDVVAVVSDGNSILDSGLLEADDLEQSLINRFSRSVA